MHENFVNLLEFGLFAAEGLLAMLEISFMIAETWHGRADG